MGVSKRNLKKSLILDEVSQVTCGQTGIGLLSETGWNADHRIYTGDAVWIGRDDGGVLVRSLHSTLCKPERKNTETH